MPKFNYTRAAEAGTATKARKALDKALEGVIDDACDVLSAAFENAVQLAIDTARSDDPEATSGMDGQEAFDYLARKVKARFREHLSSQL